MKNSDWIPGRKEAGIKITWKVWRDGEGVLWGAFWGP